MKEKRIQLFIKRIIDFVVALIGLVILSPLILLISILIKINLGSPIIFKQERPGYKEKVFCVYKFRTMMNSTDEKGNVLADNLRLTKLGIILRKLSLDEIPQLLNVIKGEMSLVGPRPLLVRYLPYYTKKERKRFDVRPGITGLAQINGRNTSSWNERLDYDYMYVKKYSLILDLKILFLTLFKVFKSDGVVVDTSSIMLNLDEERGKNIIE